MSKKDKRKIVCKNCWFTGVEPKFRQVRYYSGFRPRLTKTEVVAEVKCPICAYREEYPVESVSRAEVFKAIESNPDSRFNLERKRAIVRLYVPAEQAEQVHEFLLKHSEFAGVILNEGIKAVKKMLPDVEDGPGGT